MSDVKTWLHQDLQRIDKLLLVMATFDEPKALAAIKARSFEAGFQIPKKWNMSQILGSSAGRAVRTPKGWEITKIGIAHLESLGLYYENKAALQVAKDLRAHIDALTDPQIKSFVEEAIKCHENNLHRAAIVMSWLGAVAVLHNHVHRFHLEAFNKEAKRVNQRWKPAVTTDDLGRMGEGDILDRIAAISIIGKNVKEELVACLKSRNGCGHPNSLQVGPNKTAAHIETLIRNVFEKF